MASPEKSFKFYPESSDVYDPAEHNEALVKDSSQLEERLAVIQSSINRPFGESQKTWGKRHGEMLRLQFELQQREKERIEEIAQLAGNLALAGAVSAPEEEL